MNINNLANNLERFGEVGTIIVKNDGTVSRRSEEIVSEHFMDVVVDEKLAARLVCTPDNLVELVMGRLLTENIVSSADDVEHIYICEEGRRAKVFLKPEVCAVLEPTYKLEPTCCTGNKIFLQNRFIKEKKDSTAAEKQLRNKDKPEGTFWKKEWIFELAKNFAEGAFLHSRTKGTHSCYLSVKGRTVFAAEDIGRHNALDKVIGYAALHGILYEDCIVFTSGRVPTDMIVKVLSVGIPVMVSKAVPTDEAIKMAEENGLTLICRAWPDSFEIYTGEFPDSGLC